MSKRESRIAINAKGERAKNGATSEVARFALNSYSKCPRRPQCVVRSRLMICVREGEEISARFLRQLGF